ncbi:MAG TPA: hypothetical protein VH165_07665 [Kofleriaceae bacterium]|nr:hypothetical protein [Kofleriaceae bacterium]
MVGFLRAWAIYALVHTIATATDWRWGPDVGFVLVPPAIWLLLRPRSVAAFVTLTGTWSLLIGLSLPKVANHELLTLVMNLTMLAGLLAGMFGPGAPGTHRLERAFARFAPVLRLQIVLVYSLAVFHKLNTDFLDPDYSAAVALYRDIAASYPVLPLPGGILIAACLTSESLMAVGLCVRRLRPYIVGLGLAFHLLLSLHPNPYILSFSAMLYALYTLFVPDLLAPARVRQALAGATRRDRRLRGGLLVIGALLIALACFIPRPTGDDPGEYLRYAGRWVFLGVALGYIAGWLALDKGRAETRGVSWRAARQAPAPAWFLTGLLIFNGLCPYLGLKTGSAFAMYSNLHTEDGICNHLIMPCRAIRVAHFQDDLVEILDSSQPDLRDAAGRPWHWTYFELRRALADIARHEPPGDSFFLRYRRGGVERTLRYPEQASDEAFTPPPWLERTLLHFRPVPVDPRARVEHWD